MLLNELKPETNIQKVKSYLSNDLEGLVKSVESKVAYEAPNWANESFEAFDRWMLMSREECENDKVLL